MKYIHKTSDFEVGDWVIYRSHPDAPAEDGEVTKISDQYVYVRYRGDLDSKATYASDLEFGNPEVKRRRESV